MLRSFEPFLPRGGETSAPFGAVILMQQPKRRDRAVLPQLRFPRPHTGRDGNVLNREQVTEFRARAAGPNSEVTNGNIGVPPDNAQFVRSLQLELNLRMRRRKGAQPWHK